MNQNCKIKIEKILSGKLKPDTDTKIMVILVLLGIPQGSTVSFGILQGSVLGSIQFLSYTAYLLHLIKRNIHLHLYADDTR